MTVWTVRRERIPELVVPGRRLGRNLHHDSRSRAYAVAELPSGALRSVAWERHITILDQGDVGSCTGNAMTGALATGPLWDALRPAQQMQVTSGEGEALRIYSEAETIDGSGTYPPVDDGSSGLSVARAAKDDGLISGYRHAFSFAAFLAALQAGAVIVGARWLTGMDNPDSRGLVTFSGTERGGHEFESRELDMANGIVWFDNSWGLGYGVGGRFCMAFAEVTKMLAADGDVTVPLPLSVPAPVPAPIPPDPADPDAQFGTDPEMAAWSVRGHTGLNAYAARQYRAWQHARGYA